MLMRRAIAKRCCGLFCIIDKIILQAANCTKYMVFNIVVLNMWYLVYGIEYVIFSMRRGVKGRRKEEKYPDLRRKRKLLQNEVI